MYQRKVDVDMLNAFCSDEGLTLETSANTHFTAFSISTSTLPFSPGLAPLGRTDLVIVTKNRSCLSWSADRLCIWTHGGEPGNDNDAHFVTCQTITVVKKVAEVLWRLWISYDFECQKPHVIPKFIHSLQVQGLFTLEPFRRYVFFIEVSILQPHPCYIVLS